MEKHYLKQFKKLHKKRIFHLDLEHSVAIFMLTISELEDVTTANQLLKF